MYLPKKVEGIVIVVVIVSAAIVQQYTPIYTYIHQYTAIVQQYTASVQQLS